MNNIQLIIDTHSNYCDILTPCLHRINKYFNNIDINIFIDDASVIPQNIIPINYILYDNNNSYRNQFLNCLKQIKTPYILYSSEDYILYNYVQSDKIKELLKLINNNNIDFIKLIKGPENTTYYQPNLYFINRNDTNFFAQQASIWNIQSLIKVFQYSSPNNSRIEQEPIGSEICRQLRLTGLQYYDNTQKRGMVHYDSNIYPYIATAIVKGKWNVSEYPIELAKVFDEYNIDPNIRGIR